MLALLMTKLVQDVDSTHPLTSHNTDSRDLTSGSRTNFRVVCLHTVEMSRDKIVFIHTRWDDVTSNPTCGFRI